MEGGGNIMVDYPDLSSLGNSSGIDGLLTLPNASFPFFWVTILAGIWLIITFALYYGEKSSKGRGNLLSSAGVSAFACITLATIGSLFGLFTVTTLVPVIVFGILVIAIWLFSSG